MIYLTPIKSIRAKCLNCTCGQPKEIRLCSNCDCPLYPYRFGKNPKRKGIGGKRFHKPRRKGIYSQKMVT